ncbi:fbox domain containing protein [Stylonychia lemnae]|uniref:Fbox domain containing protein n=1 Tax=Stylonychia lemnae TaxID=5949 RepID=A0A078A972_STYLE|nr:fbox domain containing protein [Stylonychia lemnae]|eukprot:CDW77353.1 fbox domain containing protein [Stylonychia lemnae]
MIGTSLTVEQQSFDDFIEHQFENELINFQNKEPYNQRGVYFIEIRDFLWFNVINTDSTKQKYPMNLTRQQFHWHLDGIATRLFKTKDLFYMSEDMNLLSSHKINNKFLKYSEKVSDNFKGYQLKYDLTFEASPETKTLKFTDYVKLLKKKTDEVSEEDYKWIFEGAAKFLDSSEIVPKLTYATYPRSGNSFFRKYFETITGISTGNDIECRYMVNLALQMQGFKGQSVIDDRVWMVKTHYPDGFNVELDYETNKVALCVRNPLDVLASQFSFLFTWTHSKNTEQEFHKDFQDTWERLAKYQLHEWIAFHKWWIDYAKAKEVPLFFFRYEDIISSTPKDTFEDFFSFALDLKSIKDTLIGQRINDVIKNQGHSASLIYQPRSSTGGQASQKTQVNKNLHRYSQVLLDYIKEQAADLLYFFGYVQIDKETPERTGFFNYKDHDPKLLAQSHGFKEWNKQLFIQNEKVEHFKAQEPSYFKSQEGIQYFRSLIGKEIVDPLVLNDNIIVRMAN